MSYLNNTRLIFSGTYQADVSTVNNDVRHFDNATWEPRFQEFAASDRTENGWFNPVGSGAFRLIGCHVRSVHYADGTGSSDAAADPAVDLLIGGANERVAAKLVDLDPQWQMCSQIWGLEVRLDAGKRPPLAYGKFAPAAFRDITFTRIPSLRGVPAASARFQSILEGVTWSEEAANSRVLRELKALAGDTLSIRMMTFGYVGNYGDPRFSLGTVCGVIGPYLPDEPRSFVLGRRFVAANGRTSANGTNYFTAAIDEASSTLLLDLGNALPLLNAKGEMNDVGKLTVGILLNATVAESAAVTAANFMPLGEINYKDDNWLFDTSGIHAVKLSAAQLNSALSAPLALAAEKPAGTTLIAIRESDKGLMCCAEEFVQRVDTPDTARLTIHAAQFGKRLGSGRIVLTSFGRVSGLGGGQATAPNQPRAAIPDIGIPTDAVTLPADGIVSVENGRAEVEIGFAPLDKPRRYLDGQIYLIGYALDNEADNAHPGNELIVVHARDKHVAPQKPSWIPDIAPIFIQYGNLYPIMSQRLVDLSDPESVMRNLKILKLAFALDINDPNSMPVTRDLSAGKRTTILRWLDRLESEGDPTFVGGPRERVQPAAVAAAASAAAAPAAGAAPASSDKATFADGAARALKTKGE